MYLKYILLLVSEVLPTLNLTGATAKRFSEALLLTKADYKTEGEK
jgi:hypothetical protein